MVKYVVTSRYTKKENLCWLPKAKAKKEVGGTGQGDWGLLLTGYQASFWGDGKVWEIDMVMLSQQWGSH